MTQFTIAKRRFDVAIFVATDDEHKAVLEKERWHEEIDANGSVIHVQCLKTKGDFIVRLALRKLPAMGAEACVLHVSQFLGAYKCSLVTMVGVCAGIKNKVKRCDIVIPEKVASICNGKETEDPTGQRVFLPHNRTYNLETPVRKAVEIFYNRHWNGVKNEIASLGDFKKPISPSLHWGGEKMMAQVFHVRAYSGSDKDLKRYADRSVHALEMESAALAYAAREYGTPWLVMKGVQDFADTRKNDKYRKFCAVASYRTLKEFVVCCLDAFWQNKVPIVAKKAVNMDASGAAPLIQEYRQGRYSIALQKGEEVFAKRPYDRDIWQPYLQILMRLAEYGKAGELIDVADFYIQQDNSAGEHFGYKVMRAEYYWRIGFLHEAEKRLDWLISELQDVRISGPDVKSTLAQAWYVRGMVRLTFYREQRRNKNLQWAGHYFRKAVELDKEIQGKKYWAFIHLLLTQHLQGETWDVNIVEGAKKKLKRALTDLSQKTRSAPRIYRLRLAALEVAAGRSSFDDLRKIIEKDKVNLCGKLILPPDFFGEFDQDCRLLFDLRQTDRDRLLSLIYDWASVVRKED